MTEFLLVLATVELSTTATLGTEETGLCREVLNKSQWMDCFVRWDEKNGRCRRVSMGLTDRRKTAQNLVDSHKN